MIQLTAVHITSLSAIALYTSCNRRRTSPTVTVFKFGVVLVADMKLSNLNYFTSRLVL